MDLEGQYENLDNVTVTKYKGIKKLNQVCSTNSTICFDNLDYDLDDDIVMSEDFHKIKSKNVWAAISNTEGDHLEESLMNQFPDWVLVNLNHPLRTSKTISEKVKTGKVYQYLHTNNFNASLNVAANMPIGPEPLILPRSGGSYRARLQQAFSAVGKDKSALIILAFHYG